MDSTVNKPKSLRSHIVDMRPRDTNMPVLVVTNDDLGESADQNSMGFSFAAQHSQMDMSDVMQSTSDQSGLLIPDNIISDASNNIINNSSLPSNANLQPCLMQTVRRELNIQEDIAERTRPNFMNELGRPKNNQCETFPSILEFSNISRGVDEANVGLESNPSESRKTPNDGGHIVTTDNCMSKSDFETFVKLCKTGTFERPTRTLHHDAVQRIIHNPCLDSSIFDHVKSCSNLSGESIKHSSGELVALDERLTSYQDQLQMTIDPIFDILVRKSTLNVSDLERLLAEIIFGLMKLNENILVDRRKSVLAFLEKPLELAEKFCDTPKDSLFGSEFIQEHDLLGMYGRNGRRKSSLRIALQPKRARIKITACRSVPDSPVAESDVYHSTAISTASCTEETMATTNQQDDASMEGDSDKISCDFGEQWRECSAGEEEAEIAINPPDYSVEDILPNDASKDSSGSGKADRSLNNKCDHCDFTVMKRRQLIPHIKSMHPDKMIPCDQCDKSFAFQISLSNHKHAMHLEAEFKCTFCTRSFKEEDKLKTHLYVHAKEKPFVCEKCGKGCLTKVHLNSHLKVHERQKSYYCAACERQFGSNHSYQNHLKLHIGEKEWFCDICGEGFPIKARLILHRKVNHTDQAFVCDICGKGFKMKHILNDHKTLIHSDTKSFVCEVCGIGFKLRSVLKRHMKTHSDDRPHKCTSCDKAFKVRSTLVEHLKTHSNEKPFLCETCGMSFKRNSERRRHDCVNMNKDGSLRNNNLDDLQESTQHGVTVISASGVHVGVDNTFVAHTSMLSGSTSMLSGSTSVLSGSTSVLPGSTSVLPGSTSVLPGSTSVLPGSTSVLSGSTSVLPGSTSASSGSTSMLSGSTSVLPGSTSASSGSSSVLPGSSSVLPVSTANVQASVGQQIQLLSNAMSSNNDNATQHLPQQTYGQFIDNHVINPR